MDEKDSLNITVAGEVKMSFLRYAYPLLLPCIEDQQMRIATTEDIGCMKLAAVVSRAAEKDFVDLYFILKTIPLKMLLEYAAQKMPALEHNLVLKSLTYFDDVEEGIIMFRPGFEVSFSEVKGTLKQEVRQLIELSG